MKIAICIPCHGDTKALFTLSLANMLMFSKDATYTMDNEEISPEFRVFLGQSSLLPRTRNDLIDAALAWGSGRILFLDADHTFPRHALTRLLSHELPIVGCNYLRREGPPRRPVAYGRREEKNIDLMTTEALAREQPLERAYLTGLGVCLMHADVFERIERPFFNSDMTTDPPQGEDAYFFGKIHQASVPVYVDHVLSLDVGHIAEQVLTFRDEARP